MNSAIRQQRLLWLIAALIVMSLGIMLASYLLARDGFDRMRDESLTQIAHALLRVRGEAPPALAAPVAADRFVSQLWNAAGDLVYASEPAAVLPRQAVGSSTLAWQGEVWRVVVLEENGMLAQIAHTSASQNRIFNSLNPWLLALLAVMVLILGGLILSAVYRFDMALSSQRRFIADAVHELRSPLAAIRLQAQIVAQEDDTALRQDALRLMQLGVDRASRLISQLLSFARFEHPFRGAKVDAAVDLLPLTKTVIIEKSAQSDIDIGLLDSDSITVLGDHEALRVMIGNLLDNAMRYAGEAGPIDLCIRREGRAALITVLDRGPGIPPEDHARVIQPFCRLAGQSVPGSGLGLAIVAEIVAMHAGTLHFEQTPGGGLTVQIRLPVFDS